jgi:DnaK suppressor protein
MVYWPMEDIRRFQMTTELNNDIVTECRMRLNALKTELLNRVRSSQQEFIVSEKMTGDEADQSVALINENTFLTHQERMRSILLEIEYALARIEMGSFGICEETQEPIEIARLIAIPYTRLSIEGAELREASQKKFAR